MQTLNLKIDDNFFPHNPAHALKHYIHFLEHLNNDIAWAKIWTGSDKTNIYFYGERKNKGNEETKCKHFK